MNASGAIPQGFDSIPGHYRGPKNGKHNQLHKNEVFH